MGFIKDFRDFTIRGNVIDLAIAVVIGAAFAAIISSLVDDVITPLLLTPALSAVGASEIGQLKWGAVKYGSFLAALIKFIVVAFVLFSLVRGMTRLKKKVVITATDPSSTDILLTEIRDLLRK